MGAVTPEWNPRGHIALRHADTVGLVDTARWSRVARSAGLMALGGVIVLQVAVGIVATVFGAAYMSQVITGVVVIEECDPSNSCVGTFISDDGSLRREGVRVRDPAPGAERITGWIEHADGAELHTEERWGPLAIGIAFLLWALAPVVIVASGAVRRSRWARRFW